MMKWVENVVGGEDEARWGGVLKASVEVCTLVSGQAHWNNFNANKFNAQ